MTRQRSVWTWPRALLAIGVAILSAGLAWATITGVAIPYQDPTPAMQAYEDRHMLIVDALLGGGGLCILIAAAWSGALLFARAIVRRRRTG